MPPMVGASALMSGPLRVPATELPPMIVNLPKVLSTFARFRISSPRLGRLHRYLANG